MRHYEKPIYDKKVEKILELLKFMTRDEAAEELGYKNYRGMDQYMRRKNFVFDQKQMQYIPAINRVSELDRDPKSYAPTKVVRIISAFEEENADPKVIAKQAGFKDHREMAEYMKNKGYEWNAYKNNYLKAVGRVDEKEEPPEVKLTREDLPDDLTEYVPFIRFLYEKRDDIYQLLTGVKEDGKIPRYAVPGLVRTKAIYMSDMIARLAAEFSKEKNITQREIMEAALIEYLQKYGFKREIDSLLKTN
nr:MAG TPA: hypothetical protein [Caudoviricetes sp.]